jgi:hypothetical protein
MPSYDRPAPHPTTARSTARGIAVELTAHSARELLAAIQAALADAPVELTAP